MDLSSFVDKQRFESEIYIGDYSEYHKDNPTSSYKGLVLANMALPYIASLHIHNPIHIPVVGINFEYNLGIFKEQDKILRNCECMFISDKSAQKGWMLLVELKYCSGSERAVLRNLEKGIEQLEQSYLHLRDNKKLFGQNEFRCAWVISLPEHDELIPFSSFFEQPEILLDYKDKYGVDIFTDNQLTILSHEYLTAGYESI